MTGFTLNGGMKNLSLEQVEWLKTAKAKQAESTNVNPCINQFGYGPAGTRCKTCAHIIYTQFSKKYYKCQMRKITSGPATDHRVNWPACAKYIESTEIIGRLVP